MFIKLKTIHKCFICPNKAKLIAMLLSRLSHMWMKSHVIGKANSHILPIYNEYMCLYWVSALFCMIYCSFSNGRKSSTTRLWSLYDCSAFSDHLNLETFWNLKFWNELSLRYTVHISCNFITLRQYIYWEATDERFRSDKTRVWIYARRFYTSDNQVQA